MTHADMHRCTEYLILLLQWCGVSHFLIFQRSVVIGNCFKFTQALFGTCFSERQWVLIRGFGCFCVSLAVDELTLLEDFIVCQPERDYDVVLQKRFRYNPESDQEDSGDE